MTPLARRLVNQLLENRREGIWGHPPNADLLREMLSDIHCFDITEAKPLVLELAETLSLEKDAPASEIENVDKFFGRLGFAPAKKTWIEWSVGGGNRLACLLEDCGDKGSEIDPTAKDFPEDGWLRATVFYREGAQRLGWLSTKSGDYYFGRGGGRENEGPMELLLPDWVANDIDGATLATSILKFAHLALVVINSPRIVAQQINRVHRGLARRVARGNLPGFKLRDWSTIKLQVTKPRHISDGEPHEDTITGKRALHFCRRHIRVCASGVLTYVTEHWRGDPTVGIHRSDYRVSP